MTTAKIHAKHTRQTHALNTHAQKHAPKTRAQLGYIPATPVLAAAADAAAASLAKAPTDLAARDMAELMWAFAKSEYRPPEALLQSVLRVRGRGA